MSDKKKTYNKWTNESLAAEAKKYNTPGEFLKLSASAYMTSKRRGIFEEITEHMFSGRFTWTRNMIESEAKKYTTRGAFFKGSRSAYSAATRMDILEEITEHMPRYAGKGQKRGPNKRTLVKQAKVAQ